MIKNNTQLSLYIRLYANDIMESDNMNMCRLFVQHGDTSVADHVLGVLALSLSIASRLSLDVDEMALCRGCLLHDFFLYDWHDRKTVRPHHATRHPEYAFENASREFELGEIEADIILNHMFPLTRKLPETTEGRIVCFADKLCAIRETLGYWSRKAMLCRK